MKGLFSLKPLLLAALWPCSLAVNAQVQLVRNHRPASRIVVTTDESADAEAADLLQRYVQRITRADLPVLTAGQVKKIKKGDVLIGNGLTNAPLVTPELREDGYLLSTEDGCLRIVSGGDGGSVYGVATVLERYFGLDYWGEREYSYRPLSDVTVPRLRQIDNPAFTHRQTHFYGLDTDPDYKRFSRYEWVDELFVGNRWWVHTALRLVPLEKYGKTHPEYYSMINGKRRTDRRTQLCLTNPDVLEIVTHQLDSLFKAHPDRDMVSVSQNDGNHSYCRCPECQKIMDREGAPSGPYIRFMNQLAQRFPDKQISTLSYLFSVDPPKHIKPLPNVNLMLCNIDCHRQVPLDQCASGMQFVRPLEKWGSMTGNIFLWDYGINFHNYLSPFPNFHIMADNMKLFLKNNVSTYFHQLNGTRGSDFAELRTWLIAKLMWNPEQNTDALILHFLNGYYGQASAPYIYQYIKLMEGALLGSKATLWIFDTPISFKNTMLNPQLLRRYNALFDQAEAAATDSASLARIQRSRLSLRYSELEIAKTYPDYDVQDLTRKLDKFIDDCHRFNVTMLSERRLMTDAYNEFYRNRYLKVKPGNLARGAKVTHLIAPTRRYLPIAEKALTDGLLGGNTFVQDWVGWEGIDGSFVLDLGEEKEVSSLELDFLHSDGDWIIPVDEVAYSVSTDNEHFTPVGKEVVKGRKDLPAPYFRLSHELDHKQKVRYIRFDITAPKLMPSGNPSWFFVDEALVF